MRHAINLEELAYNLRPKGIPRSAWGEGELITFRVRIRPDEISHGAFVGNFTEAVDDFDLVD